MIAVSNAYTLHSTITFAAESERKLRWPTYFTFVASGVAGWLANTAALVVAAEVLLLPVWLAKLFAVMASFIVNFSMSNFVVFNDDAIFNGAHPLFFNLHPLAQQPVSPLSHLRSFHMPAPARSAGGGNDLKSFGR